VEPDRAVYALRQSCSKITTAANGVKSHLHDCLTRQRPPDNIITGPSVAGPFHRKDVFAVRKSKLAGALAAILLVLTVAPRAGATRAGATRANSDATFASSTVASATASSPDVARRPYGSYLEITTNGVPGTKIVSNAGGAVILASTSYGPVAYSPSRPSFKDSDNNGTFTGKVTFSGHYPLAWSYRINPALTYAEFVTSDVTEDADYYRNSKRVSSYHDNHVEPVDYLFHSTLPDNTGGPTVKYEVDIRMVWKWRLSNSSGTATLIAYSDYTVTGSTGCAAPAGAQEIPAC
jgi:hypothetical protein